MKLQALETYKAVHRRFPENVECLKFLVGVYSSTVDSYILSLKICLKYNADAGEICFKFWRPSGEIVLGHGFEGGGRICA